MGCGVWGVCGFLVGAGSAAGRTALLRRCVAGSEEARQDGTKRNRNMQHPGDVYTMCMCMGGNGCKLMYYSVVNRVLIL